MSKKWNNYWLLSKATTCLVLFLVPILFVSLVSKTTIGPKGSAFYVDPDWYYLGNGLTFSVGEGIHFVDHPGIPTQILAGSVLWIYKKMFFHSDNYAFVAEVLANPTFFLFLLGKIVMLANAFSLSLMGWVLISLGFPVWLILFVQALPMTSSLLIWFSGRCLPEGINFGLTVLLGSIWIKGLILDKPNNGAVGVLLGILSSNKLNYFQYVLLAYGKWKNFFHAAVFAVMTFVLSLLFLSEYRLRILYRFLSGIVLRDGRHGGGELGFPSFVQLIQNFEALNEENAFFLNQIIFISFLSLIFCFLVWRNGEKKFRIPCTLLALAMWVNLLGTLKHPGSRYLLPSFLLCPFFLLLIYQSFKSHWLKVLAPILIITNFIFLFPEYRRQIFSYVVLKNQLVDFHEKLDALYNEKRNCLVVITETATHPAWSVNSANITAGFKFSTQLEEIYRNHWWQQPFREGFITYSGVVSEQHFNHVWRKSRCVIYLGRSDFPRSMQEGRLPVKNWETVHETAGNYLLFRSL